MASHEQPSQRASGTQKGAHSGNISQPDAAPHATAESFESALIELESLVQSLEGGKLPLESALAGYQRGTELIRYCQHTLDRAEQKIQVLENGLLQDFTPRTDDLEAPRSL